jgi:hypothetical protein
VDKEVLLTRWTANPSIGSSTQVVLTFPTGGQPGMADPVSVSVFDAAENVNLSPRQVVLARETTVCTLSAAADTTQLECPPSATAGRNGFEVVGSQGRMTDGWLRILDNAVGAETDSLEALPARRFPVLGLVFSTFGGTQGVFDQSFPLAWTAVGGAGGYGGSQGFSVNGGMAPWVLGDRTPLTPGDHDTGGLALTGP